MEKTGTLKIYIGVTVVHPVQGVMSVRKLVHSQWSLTKEEAEHELSAFCGRNRHLPVVEASWQPHIEILKL